ncbi:hypothetical protein Clacol_003260 [Clathrus columnatus]|uniref:Uncharacterized protein n=1 Tax=Clathrus columnatus TaxID=1419009 RepID=A0AAV5A739_9AGAM|nr:hypothetical protein Clacol_003260 [Clathrus columnatus]
MSAEKDPLIPTITDMDRFDARSIRDDERSPARTIPPELLYGILSRTSSGYLHEMFLESPTTLAEHPGWTGIRSFLQTSFLFRAVTIQILHEVLGDFNQHNLLEAIELRIDNLRAAVLRRNTPAFYDLAGVYDIPTQISSCSPHMKVYYLYNLAVHIGNESLKDFNPIGANIRTWSVQHPRQLSPAIQVLADAWDSCEWIRNPVFRTEIEPAIVQELMYQLYVRQFQIWRWCLIRAFYLIPTASGEMRESIDASILRLLNRIAQHGSLSPGELGYQYVQHTRAIPFSRFDSQKVTRKMIEESKILYTAKLFSSWQDDPGLNAPWRGQLESLIKSWEKECRLIMTALSITNAVSDRRYMHRTQVYQIQLVPINTLQTYQIRFATRGRNPDEVYRFAAGYEKGSHAYRDGYPPSSRLSRCCFRVQLVPEIPEEQLGETLRRWAETMSVLSRKDLILTNVPPCRFDELDTSSLARFFSLCWSISRNRTPKLCSFPQTNSFYAIFDPVLDVKMIVSFIKTGVQSLLLHERRDSASSSSSTLISARASSPGGLPPGSIAAIVLGSFALLSIMCSSAWFFCHWRRRNVVRPSPTTRIDLGDAEVARVESPTNMDAAGVTGPVSFPHPYERVVRRYPPDAIRSIEPSRSEDTEPRKEQLHLQTKQQQKQSEKRKEQQIVRPPRRSTSSGTKTMRRHTTPLPISRRPPIDQLDLDLAYLSGDTVNEPNNQKPFSNIRPLPPLPVPTTVDSDPKRTHLSSHQKSKLSSSSNKSPRSSRRKRAATLTTPTSTAASSPTTTINASSPLSNSTKDKYYNRLPPSARYLAEIAKYPNRVDPDRPWNVLKDDPVDDIVKGAPAN